MDLCPIPLKWGIIAELHKDDFMQRLENEKAIDKSITNIILIKTNGSENRNDNHCHCFVISFKPTDNVTC